MPSTTAEQCSPTSQSSHRPRPGCVLAPWGRRSPAAVAGRQQPARSDGLQRKGSSASEVADGRCGSSTVCMGLLKQSKQSKQSKQNAGGRHRQTSYAQACTCPPSQRSTPYLSSNGSTAHQRRTSGFGSRSACHTSTGKCSASSRMPLRCEAQDTNPGSFRERRGWRGGTFSGERLGWGGWKYTRGTWFHNTSLGPDRRVVLI